jgi:uncharacterized protein
LEGVIAFIESAYVWVTIFIMVVALFGLVIPVFPGGVIIWIAALVFGIIEGFEGSGGWIFALITLLMVASALADNVMMGKKAKDAGASWKGIGVALVSALIGSILLTPIVGLLLAPIGLYIYEYRRLGDKEKAKDITKGLALGCGWAFVIRFGLGILKIIAFLFWAF